MAAWCLALSLTVFAGMRAWASLPAPGGFTASASDGAVSLQWGPVPAATAYYLYRNLVLESPTGTLTSTASPTATPTGTVTPPAPLVLIPEGTPPAFIDYQVTNGRNYLYQVGAFDATGLGLLASATALPFSAPNAVQPVTISNLHSNALDLTWGIPLSSFPVSYYQVFRYAVLTPPPTGTPTPGTLLPATPVPAATLLASTPIATVTGTSYTDSEAGSLLTRGFYYLVVAVDNQTPPALGLAPAFSTNPALPRTSKPAPPFLTGFVSAAATPEIGISGYGARLFWNGPADSEGVTAYQVFSGSAPLTLIAVVNPSPTYSYDDTSIPFSSSAAATTSYKVAVMNAAGSTDSNIIQENIFKSSVPNPIQVTPNNTVNATEGVTVSWSEGSAGTYGLGGYRIYKSLNGVPVPPAASRPGSPTPMGSATPTITPTPFATVLFNPSATPTLIAIDGGVSNANGWSYWVEPFDQLSLGGLLGVSTPSVLKLGPQPVGLVTAAAVPGTNNKVNVSWQVPGDSFYGSPRNYVLYRNIFPVVSPTPTPTGTLAPFLTPTFTLSPTPIATINAPLTSFDDFVPGSSGSTVLYRVVAVDLAGNPSAFSGFSNPINLTGPVAPGTPLGLPVSGDVNTIKFSWLANPISDQVDNYSVYGPDWPFLTVTPTPMAVIGSAPGTLTYQPTPGSTPWSAQVVYLESHNAQGFSQAATLSGIALPLYHVAAVMTPAAIREVHVAWDLTPVLGISTPEVNSFLIYRSTSPGINFTPIASVTLTAPSYVDSNVAAGQNYYYRVTARANSGGVSAESPLYPTMLPTPEGHVQTWPNVPSGVTVSGGVNQSVLSWAGNNASENVLSYSVLRNGIATATITPSPAMSISFNETPGTVSSYQVIAQNAQGPSDPSQPVSVLVPPAVTPTIGVTPPPGTTPTPGVTPLHLVWISGLDSTAPVDGYTIYRSTVSGSLGFSQVGSISAPASFFADTTLGPDNAGVTNFYKAAARGMGLQADPALSGALAVELWPSVPVLSMTSSSSAMTLIFATPVGNASVTNYTLYRNLYPSQTPTVIANVVPPTTSYPDANVTPGIVYNYWASAQNSGGSSDLSAPQPVIPLQPPTLSLVPLSGKNNLSWSPVTLSSSNDVTGYAVFRAVQTPGATPLFNSISGVLKGLSNTTFTDSTVVDSVSYVYKVAASSLTGQTSAFSNSVSVTVGPQPLLSLIAFSNDGLVQLRWIYQGTATNSYTIQRKLGTEPDSAYQTIKSGVVGVNYLDTGLLDKTFYTYRIITVDSLGLTAVSPPAIALPAAAPIVSNGAVSVAQGQNGNTLSWWPADTSLPPAPGGLYDLFNTKTMYPLGGYSVYRSVDGGAVYQPLVGLVPAAPGEQAPGNVDFTDGVSLVGGPSYTYLIQAYDAPPDLPGFVSPSQAVTQGLVHTTSYSTIIAYALSASTALDRNAIRPMGAPNEQKVNIRFVVTQPGKVNIKVFSLNGTFVKELVNNDFATGVYGLPGSTYPLSWDARNMNGTLVASGVYLISTEMAGGHQEFQKVAVIK